ncbi:TRSP domain-containing protein [Bacillus sp. SL00103]
MSLKRAWYSHHLIVFIKGQMVWGKTLDKPAYSYEIAEQKDLPNLSFHSLQSFFQQVPYARSHATNSADHSPYIHETGRFGLNADTEAIDQAAEAGLKLQKERKGKQTLCLGTGELMYIPMRVFAIWERAFSFHSTTRSPIHPVEKDGYAVQKWVHLCESRGCSNSALRVQHTKRSIR